MSRTVYYSFLGAAALFILTTDLWPGYQAEKGSASVHTSSAAASIGSRSCYGHPSYAESYSAAQAESGYTYPPPAPQPQRAYRQQEPNYGTAELAVRRAMPVAPIPPPPPRTPSGPPIQFDGRYATAAQHLPLEVQYAVNAANFLQHKYYSFGAGHREIESSCYDCSGSVSYALIKGGMLASPLTSKGFANYGAPGPGRFITIWVKPGEHVFMTVCGLRLDTTGGKAGEGPRWRTESRGTKGFFARHPPGM